MENGNLLEKRVINEELIGKWIENYFLVKDNDLSRCNVKFYRRKKVIELISFLRDKGYFFFYGRKSDENITGMMADVEVHYRKESGKRTIQFTDSREGVAGFYWENMEKGES